jgi:surface antigen
MKFHNVAARFALVVSCALMLTTTAMAKPLQCVVYARAISGIEIRGNANSWWAQADGRYARGHAPRVGAVLAFAATSRMRFGHVAMVSQVISDREVLLTHANWSYRGGIERDVRAVDVSPEGDWSMVKVWYARTASLGTTAYPTKGFIYADHAPVADAPVLIAHGQSASPAPATSTASPTMLTMADTSRQTGAAL